jgi:hypothetical protein
LRIALRSRERRCLALVRFHGLESFDRTERSAYLLPRSRFAVSTAFRSSAPSALQASCDRSRGIVADPPEAPLTGSRTPSGHEPRVTVDSARVWSRLSPGTARSGGRQPSWALFPYSASGTGDPFTAGPAWCPPRSGLGVSHALAGLLPPEPSRACFIPETLLGFDLQGLAPPEEPYASRRLVLSCRFSVRELVKDRVPRGSRGLLSSGIRTSGRVLRPERKSCTLLAFNPLGRSVPPP